MRKAKRDALRRIEEEQAHLNPIMIDGGGEGEGRDEGCDQEGRRSGKDVSKATEAETEMSTVAKKKKKKKREKGDGIGMQITPGTSLMHRLNMASRHFVYARLSSRYGNIDVFFKILFDLFNIYISLILSYLLLTYHVILYVIPFPSIYATYALQISETMSIIRLSKINISHPSTISFCIYIYRERGRGRERESYIKIVLSTISKKYSRVRFVYSDSIAPGEGEVKMFGLLNKVCLLIILYL